MDIFQAIKTEEKVLSDNGAVMHKSTGHALLDINFHATELRTKGPTALWNMFADALAEDKRHALKWLLYLRDVRGGIGERESFKTILHELCTHDAELGMKFVGLPLEEYGRWDDIMSICFDKLIPSQIRNVVVEKIARQLSEDEANAKNGKSVSLLAKWMPSVCTSSKATRRNAYALAKMLKMTPRNYRKTLSLLRKASQVVEVQMSANEWGQIDYERVPSLANIRYREAFNAHDHERREAYLDSLVKGDAKINANASFPHDIVWNYIRKREYDETLEQMWKQQEHFDSFEKTLVVRDGSGSMECETIPGSKARVLDACTAITLYCCEHNTGAYANQFITFSSNPKLISLNRLNTLQEKLHKVYREDDCSSTNLEATFDLVLDSAKKHGLKQDDLPKTILIISDMQFNASGCTTAVDWGVRGDEAMHVLSTLMDDIKQKWEDAGYQMPRLAFWNMCAHNTGIPIQENENGLVLLSGFSRSLLKMVCSSKLDPYQILINELDTERYAVADSIL